jgi:hypothetical protein
MVQASAWYHSFANEPYNQEQTEDDFAEQTHPRAI